MNKKKNKRGLLDDNRVVFVFALLIAIVAWVIVAGFIMPNEDAVIPNVPINYERGSSTYSNRALEIVGERPDRANVSVHGDGGVIFDLNTTDVVVYCDYSAVSAPGTYEIPLRAVQVLTENYNIIEVSPKSVTLTFEQVQTRSYTLNITAENITAADGYYADTPVATPSQVEVRGPVSEMANVAEAWVIVPDTATDRTATYTFSDAQVILVDESGNQVESSLITITPDIVSVEVPVLAVKQLPLTVNITGAPPNFDTAWFEGLLTFSVDSILVAGDETLLESKTEISVGSVDVSTFGIDDERELLTINLESGLRNLDGVRQLEISLDTSDLAQRTMEIPMPSVIVENVPAGLTVAPVGASNTNQTREVTLVGPADSIAALLPDNVTVEVEASGVTADAGTQQEISARVYVARNRRIYAIGEYTILCNVAAA